MNKNENSLSSMLPLFMVLLIDGMGLGLLFPIINSIIIEPSSGFLDSSLSIGWRDFYFGLTIGIFMICWFFGSTILGDLSDKVGRKKALMICLIGSFVGYFISAIAIYFHHFALLIVGRMVAGFTAGSQPIAQAAIVDVSTEEHKARNIGLILLAVSLGFVLGPLCGGLLSDPRIVSWFNFTTPMYFASALSLLNAFLLQITFHETNDSNNQQGALDIKLFRAIQIFVSAFKHQDIKNYSIVLLVMIFGWSNYFSFINLYLSQVHKYTTMQNALFLAVMGSGFSLGCGFLVDFCASRYEPDKTVIVNLFLTAIAIFITLITRAYPTMAWFMVFCIGITLSIAYSTILTIFSNLVSAEEQGWVMGVTGSIMAICFGLTTFFTGAVAQLSASMPLILAILGLAGSASLLTYFHFKSVKTAL